MQKYYALLFALLITLLIAINISIFKQLSHQNNLETVKISRIIDGDTLELDDGRKIRLANINAPEKNFPNYALSIKYLQQYQNTSVQLEIIGVEKYGRLLGRIHTPDYLNLELVKQGYSSKFLVEESELKIFSQAEKEAIQAEKGIWKKSQSYNCLNTVIDEKNEKVTIQNQCDKLNISSWILKDESTRTYKFDNIELNKEEKISLHTNEGKNNETDIYWNSNTNIWNNERDSLYLFDSEGKLAHYDSYGY